MKYLFLLIIIILFSQDLLAQGLHIEDNHTVLFGADTMGSGSKLMWLPRKVAFRVGYIEGDNWDYNNIGQRSVAMGDNTRASGVESLALGSSTVASGRHSTSMGLNTRASGSSSTAMGGSTHASGYRSTAMGSSTTASGSISTAIGKNTTANGYSSLVTGLYNDTIVGVQTSVTSTTPLFIIGNGAFGSLSNAMVVLKSGNIGIGENAPAAELHITSDSGDADIIISDASGNSSLEFRNGTTYKGGIGWDETNDRLFMYQNGNGLYVKNGRVGIGDIDPQGDHKLSVNGTASNSTGGSWGTNSDRRLKKNITTLKSNDILQRVLAMRGVTYEWNDDKTGFIRPEGKQYGFIAQDLQKIWPENISKDNHGYLMTAYGNYDPMFVEAIKAQQSIIEKQQDQIDQQQVQINVIMAELKSLNHASGTE